MKNELENFEKELLAAREAYKAEPNDKNRLRLDDAYLIAIEYWKRMRGMCDEKILR